VTKLCVPITEPSTDAALAVMHALPAEVDLVELRLDLMDAPGLDRLVGGRDRPVIVTNRPVREGGRCEAPEAERLETLRRAAALGADFVDVELDAVAELGELPSGVRRIVSHHDFRRTPADLDGLLREILAVGPHVAKLAVMARDAADAARVLALLDRQARRTPLIALSMGEEGLPARLLAGKFGAFLTFASQASGAESAPGQVPAEQMVGMYRFRRIGPDTAVYGVVANPVAHSMSPAVHNAAFAEADMDAVYLPFKVTDLEAFLEGFEPLGLRGLSVTIPHKQAMLALVDEADELARRIGALNTVTLRDGRRLGRNTDVAAAVSAIRKAAQRAGLEPLAERSVLLVGAGGAARAIAYGLRGNVGRLTIANRTVSRARALASELGADACGLGEMAGLHPDVIVNSTSVGMWPEVDASPVPADVLREGMVVFDAVYNPVETRLLREAKGAGATVAPGLDWFVDQAAAQFEIWTERPAPRAVMARTLRAALQDG
jgi:3-dehydroquinate dehydratase/shikimate dehydrogenase